MELMRTLLLCAIVAFMPEASGEHPSRYFENKILRWNNTRYSHSLKNQLYSDFNLMPYLRSYYPQSVFTDSNCKQCTVCMSRAIRDHNTYENRVIHQARNTHELSEDQQISYNEIPRDKRDTKPTMKPKQSLKPKKVKPKKNKTAKLVTVSKYNVNGVTRALKVKESNTFLGENTNESQTCLVYSVSKSFSCKSPEGESMLSAVKRKVSKKSKKEIKKKTIATEKTNVVLAASKKREVDSGHVPDTFMPSIEEMY